MINKRRLLDSARVQRLLLPGVGRTSAARRWVALLKEREREIDGVALEQQINRLKLISALSSPLLNSSALVAKQSVVV